MEFLLTLATLLGGLTASWFLWEKARQVFWRKKEYFPLSNEDFYHYYARQISSARSEIWITSDGFNMNNPLSRTYAEIMAHAFSSAFEGGVTVYRFQITETMHVNWIDELIETKRKYKALLKIYVNRSLPNVPNMCAIDPDERQCVSERMEHRTGLFGQGSNAATYMFRQNDKHHAQRTKELIREAISHPCTREMSVSALRKLRKDLVTARIAKLQEWKASYKGGNYSKIQESGVFDEHVISLFMSGDY